MKEILEPGNNTKDERKKAAADDKND